MTESKTPLMKKLEEQEDLKIRLYTAANLYVKLGKKPPEIARLIRVSEDTLSEMFESEEWKEAVKFWDFYGEESRPLRIRDTPSDFPIPDFVTPESERSLLPTDRTPYPLREEFLLEKSFQKDGSVRLVTYARRPKDVSIKFVEKYQIILDDDRIIKKLNILLAFPTDKMPDVKYGIKRRPGLAKESLPPIEKRKNRPKVNVQAKHGDLVEAVMRNGLVVTGNVIWVSKYNIVMRVGSRKGHRGKVILVYRHGLYDFKVIQRRTKRPKKFDDEWDEEIDL